jgi:hypothetical protein
MRKEIFQRWGFGNVYAFHESIVDDVIEDKEYLAVQKIKEMLKDEKEFFIRLLKDYSITPKEKQKLLELLA